MEDKNSNKEQGQQMLTENTVMNAVHINPTKSIITLNVNGVNGSIKRCKLPELIKNQLTTMLSARNPL